jgi:hypothetical protein
MTTTKERRCWNSSVRKATNLLAALPTSVNSILGRGNIIASITQRQDLTYMYMVPIQPALCRM